MSIYAVDQIYGIAASGNGAGTPASGGANHPGDYAPAQEVLNFCEIFKEEYSKSVKRGPPRWPCPLNNWYRSSPKPQTRGT